MHTTTVEDTPVARAEGRAPPEPARTRDRPNSYPTTDGATAMTDLRGLNDLIERQQAELDALIATRRAELAAYQHACAQRFADAGTQAREAIIALPEGVTAMIGTGDGPRLQIVPEIVDHLPYIPSTRDALP